MLEKAKDRWNEEQAVFGMITYDFDESGQKGGLEIEELKQS